MLLRPALEDGNRMLPCKATCGLSWWKGPRRRGRGQRQQLRSGGCRCRIFARASAIAFLELAVTTAEPGAAEPAARIVAPAQGEWVSSWEPVPIFYAVHNAADGYSKCFALDNGEQACSPLAENSSVAVTVDRPGSWHQLALSVVETASGGVINNDCVEFFSAISQDNPWGVTVNVSKISVDGTAPAEGLGAADSLLSTGSCLESEAVRKRSGELRCQCRVNSILLPSSGSGSGKVSTLELKEGEGVRRALEELVARDGVRSIMDAPCGIVEQANFAQHLHDVNLGDAAYLGIDASPEVFEQNRRRFPPGRSRFSFQQLDVVSSAWPEGYDAIVIRESLLRHQTEANVMAVLAKVEASGARFALLGTHLTANENSNNDQLALAAGRRVNLLRPPYCLRQPDRLYADGQPDLYVGVWDLKRRELPLRDREGCALHFRVPTLADGSASKAEHEGVRDDGKYAATVVTGLFDIQRDSGGDGRTIAEYLEWFGLTLRLNAPMVIYTERQFAGFVMEARAAIGMEDLTSVVVLTLAQLPYARYVDRIVAAQRDPAFISSVVNSKCVEVLLPWYVPLIFSKSDWLVEASVNNRFKTDSFLWMDAGLGRFFPNSVDVSKPWPCRSFDLPRGKVTVQVQDWYVEGLSLLATESGRHEYERSFYGMFMGGLFGGDASAVKALSGLARGVLEEQLSRGVFANEQVAFYFIYHDNPALFNPISRVAAAGLIGHIEGESDGHFLLFMPLFKLMACS